MTNYEYMKILPKDEMVKFFAELSGVAPCIASQELTKKGEHNKNNHIKSG